MRYLITTTTQPPFFSAHFQAENHFNPHLGMIVYDLLRKVYTKDGETWEEIEINEV